MIEVFRKNYLFFISFVLYLFIGAWILIVFQKGEFELLVNHHYSAFGDFFFKYFTNVGDGVFYVIIALIYFVYNRKLGFIALGSFLATGLVAQVLKRLVFTASPRPAAFFEDKVILHFVQGVDIHYSNSFPSGHSTTAFSVFFLMALFAKNKKLGLLFFFLAVLAAFSRVYLLQHFFVDTYFGAIIGITITLIIYLIFTPKKEELL